MSDPKSVVSSILQLQPDGSLLVSEDQFRGLQSNNMIQVEETAEEIVVATTQPTKAAGTAEKLDKISNQKTSAGSKKVADQVRMTWEEDISKFLRSEASEQDWNQISSVLAQSRARRFFGSPGRRQDPNHSGPERSKSAQVSLGRVESDSDEENCGEDSYQPIEPENSYRSLFQASRREGKPKSGENKRSKESSAPKRQHSPKPDSSTHSSSSSEEESAAKRPKDESWPHPLAKLVGLQTNTGQLKTSRNERGEWERLLRMLS